MLPSSTLAYFSRSAARFGEPSVTVSAPFLAFSCGGDVVEDASHVLKAEAWGNPRRAVDQNSLDQVAWGLRVRRLRGDRIRPTRRHMPSLPAARDAVRVRSRRASWVSRRTLAIAGRALRSVTRRTVLGTDRQIDSGARSRSRSLHG
jgi:hypothetical protein